MSKCGSCGKKSSDTITALVNGKYYKEVCLNCVGSAIDDISSNAAGYERRRGYEDNAQDTLQPYDANGKPRQEFARLYPEAAQKVYGQKAFNDLRAKI